MLAFNQFKSYCEFTYYPMILTNDINHQMIQIFFVFRPNLGVLSKEAVHLSDVIEKTSFLAEKVSSKVRELDLAKV